MIPAVKKREGVRRSPALSRCPRRLPGGHSWQALRCLSALPAACLILIVTASAQATPTEVNVRIEGKSETLFEGPILTEGHEIEVPETTEVDPLHPCDGTNHGASLTPGPTPTTAAVDAMSLIGEPWGGRWDTGFDDYFITQWGREMEEGGMSWGLVVNNVLSSVGGCQFELLSGDEVLWVYNAFPAKPLLALFAADDGYTSGARPLTATAKLNIPFGVEVLAYDNGGEGGPPAAPARTGASAYVGARVSQIQTPQDATPAMVTTEAGGRANMIFAKPGWYRLKATARNGKGEEVAVRSNRLDVCVPPEAVSACPYPVPAEDQVRVPARYAEQPKTASTGGDPGGGGSADGGKTQSPSSTQTTTGWSGAGSVARLTVTAVDRSRLLLRFTAAGRAAVTIARLVGHGRSRRWREVKRIAVHAERAGAVRVKLPRLSPGRYRVSLTVTGGATTVKSLDVA